VKKMEVISGFLRMILDFFSAFLAWILAYSIRPYTDLIPFIHRYFPPEWLPDLDFFLPFAFRSSLALVVLFILLGHYRAQERFDWLKDFARIVLGVFLWGTLIVAYFAVVRHENFFSRAMLFQAMAFSVIFIAALRLIKYAGLHSAWRRGLFAKKIILYGQGPALEKLKSALAVTYPYKLDQALGKDLGHLSAALKTSKAKEIWYVDEDFSPGEIRQVRELAAKNHLPFRFVSGDFASTLARMNLEIVGEVAVLEPLQSNLQGWGRVIKRLYDLIMSLVCLLILAPLLLVIAILIKLDSRGPIIFVQERVGKKGKVFKTLKFRSMYKDAEKRRKELITKSHRKDGPLFKIKNDPRVTKIGRYLRRFSLDELPQLFNVLKGEMSLTGPRPHLPEEIAKFTSWQQQVLQVRPGITGLAQVSGRSDLPFRKEIELDLYFIRNWDFLLELKILFRTIAIVISGKGAD
jgi:exopolysaccharide biosynthesis polyprenyl glycosylphosphotransferase